MSRYENRRSDEVLRTDGLSDRMIDYAFSAGGNAFEVFLGKRPSAHRAILEPLAFWHPFNLGRKVNNRVRFSSDDHADTHNPCRPRASFRYQASVHNCHNENKRPSCRGTPYTRQSAPRAGIPSPQIDLNYLHFHDYLLVIHPYMEDLSGFMPQTQEVSSRAMLYCQHGCASVSREPTQL